MCIPPRERKAYRSLCVCAPSNRPTMKAAWSVRSMLMLSMSCVTAFSLDSLPTEPSTERRLAACPAGQYSQPTSCDESCDDSCTGRGTGCDDNCDDSCDDSTCADYSPPAPPSYPECACMIDRSRCGTPSECASAPIFFIIIIAAVVCGLPFICRLVSQWRAGKRNASPAGTGQAIAAQPVYIGHAMPVARAVPIATA